LGLERLQAIEAERDALIESHRRISERLSEMGAPERKDRVDGTTTIYLLNGKLSWLESELKRLQAIEAIAPEMLEALERLYEQRRDNSVIWEGVRRLIAKAAALRCKP
jgi:hypothetical protein